MNTVNRFDRSKVAAALVAGFMLMNAQSATIAQRPAQEWFATEAAAAVAAAFRHSPVIIREDRDITGPIIRDDECHAYMTEADRLRRDVITSRLP